jgi:hypothetical protein
MIDQSSLISLYISHCTYLFLIPTPQLPTYQFEPDNLPDFIVSQLEHHVLRAGPVSIRTLS